MERPIATPLKTGWKVGAYVADYIYRKNPDIPLGLGTFEAVWFCTCGQSDCRHIAAAKHCRAFGA